MDEQLKELIALLNVCHADFKPSVLKAIEERKAEIGYVEAPASGISDVYQKMRMMVPEMGVDVSWFSGELKEAIIEYFIEGEADGFCRRDVAEMLRYGCKGYESYTDMELLEQFMNYVGADDMPELTTDVRTECEKWIALVVEKALLK